MSEEELEKLVIDRLKAKLNTNEVLIESFPDEFPPEMGQQYRLSHPNAAILVLCGDINYGEPMQLQQPQTFELELTFYTKKLRGENQMYDLLKTTRDCMTGFLISGMERFYPLSQNRLGYDNEDRTWRYGQKYLLGILYHLGGYET